MKKSRFTKLLLILALPASGFVHAQVGGNQQPDMTELTGDTKLACEAILCLSTGQRPSECQPSIARYFSIVRRTLSKTLNARRDFLNQCPTVKDDAYTSNLVNVLVDASGRCDSIALNSTSWTNAGDGGYQISDKMPANCDAYYANTGLDVASAKPRYVGKPERGGSWVDPANYERGLAEYNARIAREDLERARSANTN